MAITLVHIIGAVIIGGCLIVCFLLVVRQRRHQINVFKMTWKIPKETLKIITNKNVDEKMGRELENRLGPNPENQAAVLTQKRRAFGAYALVGNQRAEVLQFRQVKKIKFTEEDLDFLYNLKQLQHDNLTKFYGIQVNDSDSLNILHALVDRGTLEDFCLDLNFEMDDTFKSAFMRDILKGLQYLHKSPIKYHGYLQACTCLIDVNWVLKITLYGISNIICKGIEDDAIRTNDWAPPKLSFHQYLCFPPEHLKQYDETGKLPPRIVRGSPEGDIYCVGMIFYMMVENKDPFHKQVNTMERHNAGLVRAIIESNEMPVIPIKHKSEDKLLDACRQCWDRDPSKRPDIKPLVELINEVYPTSKGNLVDQMIRMNEKWADELEHQVAERTADLAMAQKQTMRLLNEMLPASIARDLKDGISTPPRSYTSATVMFVQICDFTALMKRSSPNQVISFLNDIFDQFDTVIRQHDAYKVETTGETYMVASGVPNENEGRHIFEVAEIALEIRNISYQYVLYYNKDYKLRIRIGFHAGPIAAGVIGIRSPRYCLFGDTVNFASRMQSNCPPNQIQTSEITARLLEETHEYKLVKRGIVHVKGKGEVNCYWLNEHLHEELHISNHIDHPLA